MKKHETLSKGEQLLAQILEECLEEDLSFIPPDREIARKHRFSEKFEETMKELLERSSQNLREREIQKHFHPRYAHLAACFLIFCACGLLFWSIVGPLSDGGASRSDTGGALESAAVTSDAAEDASAEEFPESEEASSEDAADSQESAAQSGTASKGQKLWCGQTVYLAECQEVPETLENVTTLVNCPVLDEDNPIVYLTIGNIGEETIRYLDRYELEVWLEDGWYVIPSGDEDAGEWMELEAGMAVDEEIDLFDYQIDYEAQMYRLVVRVEQEAVSVEFTFQEVFTEMMEKLEKEEISGE